MFSAKDSRPLRLHSPRTLSIYLDTTRPLPRIDFGNLTLAARMTCRPLLGDTMPACAQRSFIAERTERAYEMSAVRKAGDVSHHRIDGRPAARAAPLRD